VTQTRITADDRALIEECRARSIGLLKQNLSSAGILAAATGARAQSRGYLAIFGRDAAVCALGMAVSGDRQLEQGAITGLATLAAHQAPNGQLPKMVDAKHAQADFWYLGCIDSTLWWLIGIAMLDRQLANAHLRRRFALAIGKAIAWLEAQEHQRFYLLQQNEASDWADIMPRSGFVLYTNALWGLVKQLYALPSLDATRRNFEHLFHPFGTSIAEYRRARLLAHYARRNAANRDLYLSFVNFSFAGDEGDVFGNVLAILCGMADETTTHRIVNALERARINAPYPVRVVCTPIVETSRMWRPYMSRHQQNYVWQYHNGGIWPFVGAFWVAALAKAGLYERAWLDLANVARANALGGWAFREWLHGETLAPQGMAGQSWNAGAFLMAWHTLTAQRRGI
jgi:hypothetical protein